MPLTVGEPFIDVNDGGSLPHFPTGRKNYFRKSRFLRGAMQTTVSEPVQPERQPVLPPEIFLSEVAKPLRGLPPDLVVQQNVIARDPQDGQFVVAALLQVAQKNVTGSGLG